MSALAFRMRIAVRDRLREDFPRLFLIVEGLRQLGIDAMIALFPERYIGTAVLPEDEAICDSVRNLTVVHPAERIRLAPAEDPFSRIALYYPDGWCERPNVFVCELPDAFVHVRSGMVCTSTDFSVLVDRGMEHRVSLYPRFRKRRPDSARQVDGPWSTLASCNSENFWHWMLDCLPKIELLRRVLRGEALTIFMPASALRFQRFTPETVLPHNFNLVYVKDDEWLQPQRYVHASPVSHLCMGLVPQAYYDAIRRPIFARLGLPPVHVKTERIFISRRGAAHRRIRNEDKLAAMLERYGFCSVQLEKLSFEDQVTLFHRADIVVGPHGAGIGTTFFSGDVDVVVLYSVARPGNYFHTQAQGLGQRHHFVCHDEAHEDNWFTAKIDEVERVLVDELGLGVRQAVA